MQNCSACDFSDQQISNLSEETTIPVDFISELLGAGLLEGMARVVGK